jgi:feruloyl esterase
MMEPLWRPCGAALVATAIVFGPSVGTARAATDCAALAQMSLPDTRIGSATLVAAAAPLPEHCNVLGTAEGTIKFRVALPTKDWNGKLFVAGGGGFNGAIPNLNQALARGYAAVGSDTGHEGQPLDASWALDNRKAQIDYAYRATHLVTGLAKDLLRAFYSAKERHAYFVGCSNGGKMGLMAVLRYPEDYDGVVIGNFVTDRTRLMTAYAWTAQALAETPIPPSKVPVIARATLAACDAQDGLVDGVIDRPDRCSFSASVLACPSGDGPNCLTAGQVKALEKIWSGPKNSAGTQLFPGFLPGHEEDYPAFITGDGTRNSYPSSTWKLQDGFFRFFVFGPDYESVKSFDVGKSEDSLAHVAPDQDAGVPDVTKFKAHGGKLIMYHGWADHSIPPLSTVEYYGQIRNRFADSDRFVRLFMAPGLHHCTGGPGPNNFGGANQGYPSKDDPDHDVVRALDRWVEEGVAPERIIATKFVHDDRALGVERTRPLCQYPLMAQYKGSGSVDEAANFVCAPAK